MSDDMDGELFDYFGSFQGKKKKKPVKAAPKRKKAVKKGRKSSSIKTVKRKRTVKKDPVAPPAEEELPYTDSSPDKRDQLEAVREFFAAIKSKDTIYVGIDPGIDGALGFIHPYKSDMITAVDMPTITVDKSGKTKKGNKRTQRLVDVATVWEYAKCMLPHRGQLVVCLERLQPRNTDTPVTAFSLGYSCGMWPLFLYSHGIAMELITPQSWKRKFNLLKTDKEKSRLEAQRLFPMAPLSRVKDHGRAESLLIAEAVKRRREEN